MIKKYKKVIALFVALAVIITVIPFRDVTDDISVMAQAAAKGVTISEKEVSIGLGKQGVEQVLISNKKEGAVYSYKSSNKKIVRVDSEDILTGESNGTAKIIVREKHNNKTKTVGSYNVTVKESALSEEAQKSDYLWAEIGKETFVEHPFNLQKYIDDRLIEYRNMDAKYKFYSGNTKILKIKSDGLVEQTLKAGSVRITIKETYKDMTRTLGNIGMSVKKPKFTKAGKSINVVKYSTFDINKYLEYLTYYYVVLDNKEDKESDVLKLTYSKGVWNGKIKAATCGAVSVTVYTDTKPLKDTTYKKKKCLGSMKVNVIPKPAKTVKFVYGDINGKYKEEDKLSIKGSVGKSIKVSYIVKPKNCTDDISVISSSEKIADIVNSDYKYRKGIGEFTIQMKKTGKTTIRLYVGDVVRDVTVQVSKK